MGAPCYLNGFAMLSDRQRQLLAGLGVEVWQRRVPGPGLMAAAATEVATEPAPSPPNSPPAAPASSSPSSPLAALAERIRTCQLCPLHTTRIHTVPGIGAADADWMFIGEAPGQNEDEQGVPFVGRAGQLLDAMLAALRLQRDTIFIANINKCRPPGNRDPRPEEVAACTPYLHEQLAIIQPRIIIALGRVSAQTLLQATEPLAKLRGRAHHYAKTPLVVTYHPAYLLRSPQHKAKAWEDLLLARSIVQTSMGG